MSGSDTGPVEQGVSDDLGRLEGVQGVSAGLVASALTAARLLDGDPGGSAPGLLRELRATMALLMADAPKVKVGGLDELRAAREARRGA